MDRTKALERLESGNNRFSNERLQNKSFRDVRLTTAANGQEPFATVLACADSRVPVEYVFDQGLGDLFVLRVAGNICDTATAASIELGSRKFGIPLIVIMGHSDCGAIRMSVDGSYVEPSLHPLTEKVHPAAEKIMEENAELPIDQLVDLVAIENVYQSISDLLGTSSYLQEKKEKGEIDVIGAFYNLESGKVDWLPER